MDALTILVCATLSVVDGDTVKCDGINLRPMGDGAPYVSGFDTPEINQHADCPEEHQLGMQASRKMGEYLISPGLVIEDSGEVDRYGRPLVVLRLPDGSTVGRHLIEEGYAAEWLPGYQDAWCDN